MTQLKYNHYIAKNDLDSTLKFNQYTRQKERMTSLTRLLVALKMTSQIPLINIQKIE